LRNKWNAIIIQDKAWSNVTSTEISNCFWNASFFNVFIDTVQQQADSGSSLFNDIVEDYVMIDDDFTSEIATDEI